MSSGEDRRNFHQARDLLVRRLAEAAPGRIQLLAGPRQVGKTPLRQGSCRILAGA
jgi:predicted AAA+ superfamily ATPase